MLSRFLFQLFSYLEDDAKASNLSMHNSNLSEHHSAHTVRLYSNWWDSRTKRVCFLTSAIENNKHQARKDKGRKAIWFYNWLSTPVTQQRCLALGVWHHKPLDTHVGSRANMTRTVKIIEGIFHKINHGDCQLKRLPSASLSMLCVYDWISWTEFNKIWI